jgi:peroxiredoxin family protein
MDSMIAAILESGRPERLYTGLSRLERRTLVDAPAVVEAERAAFARTLAELRDTALALEDCRLWACAAAVAAAGLRREDIEARLDGVMSTPRFLREVAGAQLVVL